MKRLNMRRWKKKLPPQKELANTALAALPAAAEEAGYEIVGVEVFGPGEENGKRLQEFLDEWKRQCSQS